MIKKLLISLLLLAVLVYGVDDRNSNGFDTLRVLTGALATDSIRYSDAMLLSAGEDIRWIMMCDDSTNAGFASDSIQFRWGYQTGSIVIDSSLSSVTGKDTIWDIRIVIDTMDIDSFFSTADTIGYVESDGSLTRPWNNKADTSNVAGFAVQTRWFVPEWDELIRWWGQGMAGNDQNDSLEYFLVNKRRTYVQTRGK